MLIIRYYSKHLGWSYQQVSVEIPLSTSTTMYGVDYSKEVGRWIYEGYSEIAIVCQIPIPFKQNKTSNRTIFHAISYVLRTHNDPTHEQSPNPNTPDELCTYLSLLHIPTQGVAMIPFIARERERCLVKNEARYIWDVGMILLSRMHSQKLG